MRVTKKKLKQLRLLTLLSESEPKIACEWLHFLNDEALDTIGELTKNILFRRGNLTPEERSLLKEELKQNQKVFKKIAKKKTRTELKRKHLIQQSGSGLLSLLLSIGIPILTSLLFDK